MKNRNQTNKEDDHIDLDEIDLSLNETHSENSEIHKHNNHEEHIKLNYVKDLEENNLKSEDKEKNYYNPDDPKAQYSQKNQQDKLSNEQ
jgi:hypothetical protein